MQTPRPDHFTYPPHGDSLGRMPAGTAKPWMRAVFIGGLIGAFALGLAISLSN